MSQNTVTTAVSDNIDSRNSNPTDLQSLSTMSQSQAGTSSNARTYGNAASSVPQNSFPKNEQAIIMHATGQYKLFDYVRSLGAVVCPKDITFASRISNNRICIFLSSTRIVDELMRAHTTIKVIDTEVPIRRLINPAKRIIISNVVPSIPHEVVEDALKSLGLKLVSPVTYLRAGMPDEGFNHLLSFRRQVYISPPQDDNTNLHTSVLVFFNDTRYRIFLSTDDLVCFVCKKPGHIANKCTSINEEFPSLTQEESTKKRPASPSTPSLSHELSQSQDPLELPADPVLTSQEFKIPPVPQQAKTPKNDQRTQDKPKIKKLKKSATATTEDQQISYQLIEDVFRKNQGSFQMPFVKFKGFLENSFSNKDPLTEARRFTNDVDLLLSTMKTAYQQLDDRRLKNRFTRLSKRLKQQLQEEGQEIESITSQLSQEDREEATMDFSDASQESY